MTQPNIPEVATRVMISRMTTHIAVYVRFLRNRHVSAYSKSKLVGTDAQSNLDLNWEYVHSLSSQV